ncbi:SDR family NAD(P)-dependent oxidoreductase [Salinimicrobium oceani]|uniref:SDR family oxidoreductase n=1 Tax=Salinimicrobium oceani TaxID=2722702 RepID=A0ABX1CWE9_9FLAO|nr:SDR family oxidoreductase [Salinimicrobium oceani]NJW52608.1 SDR family oxidoreductase [Salinimicrobium oceani]
MKDKVVIISGAASGIGEATALLFGKEGAKVIVADIDIEAGKEVVKRIERAGGIASFFKVDVASAAENKSLVDFAVSTYGRLDIAVNNAGIGGEANKIVDMSLEGWHRVIDVNLHSIFYGMKYQIEAMLKTGQGSIINISSILGSVGFEGSVGYVAAKHAIVGMTRNAALEYSSQNIRINAVGPAFIDTPLLDQIDDDIKKQLISLHPIGRLGRSQEVAELILWLGNDKASFATGSYYPIDGGYLAR